MVNYNINGNKKSKSAVIVTLVFALLGTICLIIGYHSEFLWWLKNVGIVLLVIAAPLVIWLIYKKLIKDIKDM